MQYAIAHIKDQILDLVIQVVGVDVDRTQLELDVPPSSELGDLALPCFYLAKLLRRSPNQIAQLLKDGIHPAGIISAINVAGPYLNFTLNSGIVAADVIGEVVAHKGKYGSDDKKSDKVLIEYSAPNTHKEFHVGHLRNNLIGSTLVRLYEAQGYAPIPLNYIGDIGAHVAKCLWALDAFHKDEPLPKNKGKYLGSVYTDAVRRLEANPELKSEVDEVLRKLEAGDKYWTKRWKETRAWSLEEFAELYKTLGITFKHTFYESEVEKSGKKIVAELLKKGVAKHSEGAVVIDLEQYGLKTFLLLKSDGSSLYSTKDLALGGLKLKKYPASQSLYVIDTRQSFYTQQLFKTLEIIGITTPLIHVPYEIVTLKDGAMSSRSGNIISVEDFLTTVNERARTETAKRHQDWTPKQLDDTSKAIAMAAIKFNMLRVSNNNIVVFDIDEALSFEGMSGPYLLYTISRINSLVKKAGRQRTTPDYSRLDSLVEKELLLALAEFPAVCSRSCENRDPSEVARHLFSVAQLYSTFYQKQPILTAEPPVAAARLALSRATQQVLTNGLELLGITAVERM